MKIKIKAYGHIVNAELLASYETKVTDLVKKNIFFKRRDYRNIYKRQYLVFYSMEI